jgi:hypothetical protein
MLTVLYPPVIDANGCEATGVPAGSEGGGRLGKGYYQALASKD